MAKYRSIPVITEIEAERFNGSNNPFNVVQEHKNCNYRMCDICGGANERIDYVRTSDRRYSYVKPGDFVTKNSNGEFDVISDKTLASKYELIE